MNIFTHIYAHTRTRIIRLPPLCDACGFYAGNSQPALPVSSCTHTPFGVCVYMGDIKAIDAKHFATGYAYSPTQKPTNVGIYVCVLGSCRPS
jgi:hypothetical protein